MSDPEEQQTYFTSPRRRSEAVITGRGVRRTDTAAAKCCIGGQFTFCRGAVLSPHDNFDFSAPCGKPEMWLALLQDPEMRILLRDRNWDVQAGDYGVGERSKRSLNVVM